MRDVPALMNGYRRFQANLNSPETDLYRSLAEEGQAPKTMVIACCDSRVDPHRTRARVKSVAWVFPS